MQRAIYETLSPPWREKFPRSLFANARFCGIYDRYFFSYRLEILHETCVHHAILRTRDGKSRNLCDPLRPISILAISIRAFRARLAYSGPLPRASVADIQFDSLNRIFDARIPRIPRPNSPSRSSPTGFIGERGMETTKGL